MDYSFEIKNFPQAPDSTQNSSSFMQLNDQGFTGQQSIMSTNFEKETADSIIKKQTRRPGPYKKKIIKAHKYFESDLLVQKDSFFCVKNMKADPFASLEIKVPLLKNLGETYVPLRTDTQEKNKKVSKQIETSSQFTSTQSPKELKSELDSPVNSLSGDWWLMGVLLFILFLFAFIKMHFNNKLKLYQRALVSYQLFSKMYKEQNSITQKLSLLLSSLFYLNISLIAIYTVNYFSNLESPAINFTTYLLILLFFVLIFTILAILNKALAFVFEAQKVINEYLYNTFFVNRILGVTLLPFAIFYPYLPDFISKYALFLAWILVLFSFIPKWFRGLQISFNNRIPFFYMFLYLCTLEILPILILIKLVSGQN